MESSATAPAPYFCFKCNKYLHPEHVQDFQCRFCNTGFIEEIHPGVNNLNDDDDPRNNSNASSDNGINIGQLLGMFLGGGNGGGVVIGGNAGGGSGSNRPNNAARQESSGSTQSGPRQGGNAGDFIQAALQLMPAFLQAMSGNNATGGAPESNASNRRSASSGPSSSNRRRQGAGSDEPEPHQHTFLEDFIRNLAPANAQIRIQFGNGGMNIGNVNLGDFATDAGFDEIVTQILNQFDPSANNQRISEEDLQHLPRSKVTQQHVDNESQCTTCMDQFNLHEEVGELACHHIFHPDCIIPWLRSHNTCPVCRQTVNPENWRQNPANPVPPEQKEGFKDGDELD